MAVLPPDPVYVLRCPDKAGPNSLCFHQNDRLLAGTLKGNVLLWDLQTNRSSLRFSVGSQPIITLHHTHDLLISQEKDGTITLWSMENAGYTRHRTFNTQHIGFCRSVLLDNLLFYPSGEDSVGILHVNDPNGFSQTLVPTKDKQSPKLGMVACLKAFKFAAKYYVLAGYESGHFITWDIDLGKVVDVHAMRQKNSMALDYDPCTNRGIIGGFSENLTVFSYQPETMKVQPCGDMSVKNPGINCIRIRSDLKILSTGGLDGRIRMFSWKSLRPLAVLTEHKTGAIMDISYSTDKVTIWKSPIMAVAGMDSVISLWDLYN
uniref:Guanine nucleotide-binding protein subunit beta-like protein 1 n=1 Tax=Glossina austeni TaxID=7395 RepID=A0A1A9V0Z7_GLOAU